MISQHDLSAAANDTIAETFEADALDLVKGQSGRSILSFVDDARFLGDALANPRLGTLLVTPELAPDLDGFRGKLVLVDDPRWYFYSLHNYLTAKTRTLVPTQIAPDAAIASSAHVEPHGVVIGPRVVVEPNAVVMSSVSIGADSIVRAGTCLGTSGFEHKRTSRGILTVVHDGGVTVGIGVEIGALSVIGQGFSRRETIIGNHSKLDHHAMLAHGTQLGERVFVAAGAVIAGSVTIGDDAWIGPGVVIADQIEVGAGARVGIGSVVLRPVRAGSKVLGNPARPIADSSS